MRRNTTSIIFRNLSSLSILLHSEIIGNKIENPEQINNYATHENVTGHPCWTYGREAGSKLIGNKKKIQSTLICTSFKTNRQKKSSRVERAAGKLHINMY
jgi:hypothetical protein